MNYLESRRLFLQNAGVMTAGLFGLAETFSKKRDDTSVDINAKMERIYSVDLLAKYFLEKRIDILDRCSSVFFSGYGEKTGIYIKDFDNKWYDAFLDLLGEELNKDNMPKVVSKLRYPHRVMISLNREGKMAVSRYM